MMTRVQIEEDFTRRSHVAYVAEVSADRMTLLVADARRRDAQTLLMVPMSAFPNGDLAAGDFVAFDGHPRRAVEHWRPRHWIAALGDVDHLHAPMPGDRATRLERASAGTRAALAGAGGVLQW